VKTVLSAVSLARPSIVDGVVEMIRKQILDGGPGLAGAQMSEEAVADAFGVARATARSAVSELVYSGVLGREPNKPAYVPQLTERDVRDLFRVRRPIELEAIRLITRKNLPVPKAAVDAVDALATMGGAPAHAVIDTNLRFHRALIGGVNNQPLLRCFDALNGEISLALAQSGVWVMAPNAAREHHELLNELADHRWSPAKAHMLRHLKESARAILIALEANRSA
jgi:DNA-binding GntR family transcriptional regulator